MASLPEQHHPLANEDTDPQESLEWLGALAGVIENEGTDRAHFLIEQLIAEAREEGIDIPYSANHYRIQYRDSSGLDYKDGKIHKNYIRWVRLLDKGIVRELKDHQNERTARQLSESALAKPL